MTMAPVITKEKISNGSKMHFVGVLRAAQKRRLLSGGKAGWVGKAGAGALSSVNCGPEFWVLHEEVWFQSQSQC